MWVIDFCTGNYISLLHKPANDKNEYVYMNENDNWNGIRIGTTIGMVMESETELESELELELQSELESESELEEE